jgi:hypothetical protein
MTSLEIAKEKLRIPELWERRGWPGKPGRACPVPYREDTKPSGSVYRDGLLFHDFATGETFDAPALLARVEDLDMRDACIRFLGLAGVQPGPVADYTPPRTLRRTSDEMRAKPTLPPLREPTAEEIAAIAAQRGIRPGACELARLLGFLHVTTWNGLAVWAITDKARWSCQYRRLDGMPFEIRGGHVKTITARGSWASWPVGIAEAAERERVHRVILCEGSTDFLAAFSLIWEEKADDTVQPVAMLGAGGAIPEEAIPLFRAVAEVLIVPDHDKAGAAAAVRWEHQLLAAGISASCFDLSGLYRHDNRPVKDLNDLCRMEPGELARLRPIVSYPSESTLSNATTKTV